MALHKSRNLIFVRPVQGEFETSKKVGMENDKAVYEKNRYSSMTGKLTGLELDDETYEGNKYKVVLLYITDDSNPDAPEVYRVKYKQKSWFMQNFFAYIDGGLNLDDEFTIGVGGDKIPKSTVFAWVKQVGNDKLAKDKNFPKPGKVTVGDEEVSDWSLVAKRINELIEQFKNNSEIETPADKPVAQKEEFEEIPF